MKQLSLSRGKHCFLLNGYKVFDYLEVDKLTKDIPWGDDGVSLREATKIQNIAWLYDLAPRVFNVMTVRMFNKIFLAQHVEVFEGLKSTIDQLNYVQEQIVELGKVYGFYRYHNNYGVSDIVDNRLVDFDNFRFEDNYLEKIKNEYVRLSRYGNTYYHPINDWGLTGSPRDNVKRIDYLKLNDIDYKGKTVLDLGCAGGFFCRDAVDRGAKKVTGIDLNGEGGLDIIKAAYLVSNIKEYWGIDYINYDLRKGIDKSYKSDIIYYLSMNYHIGIPQWLKDITGKMLIFEDNSKERNAEITLKKMYREVRFIGKSLDHGNKLIYHCFV